jgi:hypothetical protein
MFEQQGLISLGEVNNTYSTFILWLAKHFPSSQ